MIEIDTASFVHKCNLFYGIGHDAEDARCEISKLANDPHSIFIFHNLLCQVEDDKSRFLILSTLASKIPIQWKNLKESQKTSFREYYFQLVQDWGKTGNTSQVIMKQLDNVLVQILFEEWPEKWSSFINEMILSSVDNKYLAYNSVYFFALFSEQLRSSPLVSERKMLLRDSLQRNFKAIYHFIVNAFKRSNDVNMRIEALNTLSEYLKWIDLRNFSYCSISDVFYDLLICYKDFRVPILNCLIAILSRDDVAVDALMSQIFQKFLCIISSHLDLLKEEELIPSFVKILSKFICLDNCALMPNDLIAELMFEYTKSVDDPNLFSFIVDTWHHVTQCHMLSTNALPFSSNFILPLEITLCSRMYPPFEFNGEKDVFEKMAETLTLLFKAKHTGILSILIEKLENNNEIENFLPYIYSIGSLSGVLSIEEENQFMDSVFKCLYSKSFLGDELIMLHSIYLASCFPRYLANQRDLHQHILIFFYNSFEKDLSEMEIILKTFTHFTKTCGKIMVDEGFVQPFFANISNILPHIQPNLQILFFKGMINLVKMSNKEKEQMSMILLNQASSIEVLTELIQISNKDHLEQIEQIITEVINLFTQSNDLYQKHLIYELFNEFLKAYPKTKLINRLIDILTNDFIENHSFEVFDCFITLINHGIINLIPHVFNNIIHPTFSEISSTYTEHPEHRFLFYTLIQSIFNHFPNIDQNIFHDLISYTFFGIKHPQLDISEISINCISTILSKVEAIPSMANEFYSIYFIEILSNLLETIFDGMHSFLFTQVTQSIIHLLQIVALGNISVLTIDDLQNAIYEKVQALFHYHEPHLIFSFAQSVIQNISNCSKLRQIFENFIIKLKTISINQIDPDILEIDSFESNLKMELLNDVTDYSIYIDNETELDEV